MQVGDAQRRSHKPIFVHRLTDILTRVISLRDAHNIGVLSMQTILMRPRGTASIHGRWSSIHLILGHWTNIGHTESDWPMNCHYLAHGVHPTSDLLYPK